MTASILPSQSLIVREAATSKTHGRDRDASCATNLTFTCPTVRACALCVCPECLHVSKSIKGYHWSSPLRHRYATSAAPMFDFLHDALRAASSFGLTNVEVCRVHFHLGPLLWLLLVVYLHSRRPLTPCRCRQATPPPNRRATNCLHVPSHETRRRPRPELS